jgi:tRNA-2-methylthio-N6-dimethylallyladenosine synthase
LSKFLCLYIQEESGTKADKMEEQIPEEIKHQRFERLKKLVESQTPINNKKYIGTKQEIIVEGKSKNNEKMLMRKNKNK